MIRNYKLWGLILLSTPAFGLTTGKIRGIVKDAKTGEALPYANVVIEETVFGAATDLKGEYIIVNAPVGSHTMIASMLGYANMKVQDVRVSVNMTTTVNFKLEPAAIRGKEVVVKAKRPIIQRDVTASSKRMSGKQITQMPVSDYEDVIALQSGAIETGGSRSGGLHIRGGRSDEVVYIVDGINTTDPVSGKSGAILDNNAIQEMLVISGGFDAEYGNAMSGVVNVVTREGKSKYEGRLKYTTDQAFPKSDSLHNTQKLFEQGYNFGLNNLALTLGGPLPWIKKATFFSSGGYKSYDAYLPGSDSRETKGTLKLGWRLTNDFKATLSSNYAYKDYHKYWHSFSKGAWADDTPRYERWNSQVNLKLNHTISSKTFYTINIGRFETARKIRGQNGRDFNDFSEIGKRLPWVSIARDSLWYNPETKEWKEGWSEQRAWNWYYENVKQFGEWRPGIGWKWHSDTEPEDIVDALNFRRYETATFSLDSLAGDSLWYRIDDTTAVYYHTFDIDKYIDDVAMFIADSLEEQDIQPSGNLYEIRYNKESEFGRFNYYFSPKWHDRTTTRYSIDLKLTTQLNRYNEVKFGTNTEFHKLHLTDIVFTNRNPYIDYYDKEPLTIAAYVSDKIEYEDMVLKLGLRADYFDPKSDFYIHLDSLEAGKEPAEPKFQFSPRVGICYAVSDKSAMFANYGHFFQLLNFADIYQNLNADITVAWPKIGNPDLPPQKEIMYEGGLKYAFTPDMSAEITAYFKDVKTLLAQRQMTTIFHRKLATYTIYELHDFALVKGIDLTFTKRARRFLSGSVSYSFQSAKGTGSSASEAFYFYYYYGGTGEPPQREFPLEYDITHTIKTNLNLYLPKKWGPQLSGMNPLADLNTNIQFMFHTGPPYTPTDQKGTSLKIGSKRLPAVSNIDIRVDKGFEFGSLDFSLFGIVRNLLNTENVVSVYSSGGLPDRSDSYPKPKWDESHYTALYESKEDYYKERYGWKTPKDMYDANVEDWSRYYNTPLNYGNPRIIRVGIELKF